MKDISIGMWFLIAIAVEVAVLFLFASQTRADAIRREEWRGVVALLGEPRAAKAHRFADHHFKKHWVTPGVVSELENQFVPTEEQRARSTGMEEFGRNATSWIDERLAGFWPMTHEIYVRLYIMIFMLLFVLPGITTSVIDGVIMRTISIENEETARAVYFHGAKWSVVVAILFPLLTILLPQALDAYNWLLWMCFFPIAIWFTMKNVQEL